MLTAPRKQGKLIKISCRAAPEFEYYFIFWFFFLVIPTLTYA